MRVGIVDSVCDPGDDFGQFNKVERSDRLLDTQENITTSHGSDVTRILSYFANNPIYQFYQIVDEDGNYDDGDLINAIVWAVDYGVDVLNLSVGTDHFSDREKDCDQTGPDCAITEAVEYAAENGVVVVAAVGNEPNADAVCCPAISEETIAIGGCVVRCTATMSGDELMGTSDIRPPHAYWIERDSGISGTFCSTRGCAPGESCDQNRSIESWEGNTRFVCNTPDTLAPVTFPREDYIGLIMGGGTSFATPIVTATVLTVVEVLTQKDIVINPNKIRRIIRVTGNPVSDVPVGVLDATEFTRKLFSDYGLGPLRRDESSSLYRT